MSGVCENSICCGCSITTAAGTDAEATEDEPPPFEFLFSSFFNSIFNFLIFIFSLRFLSVPESLLELESDGSELELELSAATRLAFLAGRAGLTLGRGIMWRERANSTFIVCPLIRLWSINATAASAADLQIWGVGVWTEIFTDLIAAYFFGIN